MSKVSQVVLWGVFAATLPALGGCLLVAAAGGTGATVWYLKGDLESRVAATPTAVTAATTAAMRDLDMHVISEAATSIDGKVVGRTAADKKVTVTIKEATKGSSNIAIRVGTFGDEQLSAAIYERIKRRLQDDTTETNLVSSPARRE